MTWVAGAVQRRHPARAEDVRPQPHRVLDHRRSGAQAVDFSAPVLRREAGRGRRSATSPAAAATTIARAEGLPARRAGRHHQLRGDRRPDRARPASPPCSTPTTTRSSRCPTARSTRSSSTCRPPSTSPPPSWRAARSSGSCRSAAARRSSSARCWTRTARSPRASRQAVERLRADGTLAALEQEWLASAGTAPRTAVIRAGAAAPLEPARAGAARLPARRGRGARRWSRSLSTLVFAAAGRGRDRPARRAGRGCRRRSSTRTWRWESLPAGAGRAVAQRPGARGRRGRDPRARAGRSPLLRTLRGPVFFPVRALAAGYVDLFRGVPLLIALYLIGFGRAGAAAAGHPHRRRRARHDHADPRSTPRTWPRCSGPASSRCTPRSGPRPARWGCRHRQSMRLVVLPQAVRRVLPPLLNDFVALQKDVGLISVLGAVDAIRAAQIDVGAHASTSRRTSWPGCCSCCSRSRPAGSPTRWRPGRPGGRGAVMTTRCWRSAGLVKRYGDATVLGRRRPRPSPSTRSSR